MAKSPEKEQFALFSANCMSCKHLCPETGKVAYVECHFTKGNKQCPASEVRFVIVGEAFTYAQKVLRARDKRFSKAEARLMRHVSKQSDAFKSKFYDFLENGCQLD